MYYSITAEECTSFLTYDHHNSENVKHRKNKNRVKQCQIIIIAKGKDWYKKKKTLRIKHILAHNLVQFES